MAVIMRNCRYLHTPKTAGYWVTAAIANANVIHAHVGGVWEHVDIHNCPGHGLSTIAFVREPWSWWKSYWVFKMTHGWDDKNPFDRQCRADDFELFLRHAVEERPGHWTKVCELYTGTADREIEFVGRFESLADDLVTAMTASGETFDEGRLRETPPTNVGKYKEYSTDCSRELKSRILTAERNGIDRFGYGTAGA